MDEFKWRGLDKPEIYHSEDYLGFALNSRSTFNALAKGLIEEGDYERSREVLVRCLEVMPNVTIPYDYFNIQQVALLLQVGEQELADNIADVTSKDAIEWLDYYLANDLRDPVEFQKKLLYLNTLTGAYRANGQRERAAQYEDLFTKYYTIIAGEGQPNRSNF